MKSDAIATLPFAWLCSALLRMQQHALAVAALVWSVNPHLARNPKDAGALAA